ncbi:RhuM family protein [Streptacidiphilus cavernicola]|uniref:RhuM family protein n=1 Tax=Streptacidiphilus cavernicola TaxID=3342716 RepID=A0ABV6VXV4_9ACTN
MSTSDLSLPTQHSGRGRSPFETIRRTDEYGREFWSARELMPFMGYGRWQHFEPAIARAQAAARNVSDRSAVFTEVRENPSGQGGRPPKDFHLSRGAAYYVALNGDPTKPEVAAAQAYFVHSTRRAELDDLVQSDINDTALARAREKIDYQTFRDTIASIATDYEPSSRNSSQFFAVIQNKLYIQVTGSVASDLRGLRQLETWPGRAEGKPEPGERAACRNIAKNYLTSSELGKINRLVAILTLMAEEIVEDNVSLTLAQWEQIVDTELALRTRRLTAA